MTRWDAELYAANTKHHRQYDAELLRGLTLPRRARVLDVGCGVGDFTARLAELARDGEVLGVDADPDMVATATRRQGSGRLRFAVGRAQELDRLVPAGSVDAAFSVAALHWVPAADHPTVLAQLRKVLRGSGFVRAQFGGSGQIAALRAILDEESARLGGGSAGWYFPTAAEYGKQLAAAGLTTGAGGWVRLLEQRRSFPSADSLAGYLYSQVLGAYDPVLPDGAVPAFREAAQTRALAELRRADGTYDQDFVRLDLLAVPS